MRRVILAVLLLIFLVACSKAPAGPGTISGEQKNPSCVCIAVYDPVCGSDRHTYSNACQADCVKVSWTQGACA